jgi:hypothetical protein
MYLRRSAASLAYDTSRNTTRSTERLPAHATTVNELLENLDKICNYSGILSTSKSHVSTFPHSGLQHRLLNPDRTHNSLRSLAHPHHDNRHIGAYPPPQARLILSQQVGFSACGPLQCVQSTHVNTLQTQLQEVKTPQQKSVTTIPDL